MANFPLSGHSAMTDILEVNIKFQILNSEELSFEIKHEIINSIINTKKDFKIYCERYILNIEKTKKEGYKRIIVNKFNIEPETYYYKLTSI